MRQVQAWKRASYREVAHLPPAEALLEIMRRAHSEADSLGFTTCVSPKPSLLAETPTLYHIKRKPRRK